MRRNDQEGAVNRTFTQRLPLVVGVVGLAALAVVAYFDMQSNLPFNDEWARRWTIERALSGHGLNLWGTNPGLVQLAAAFVPAIFHAPEGMWRWSSLPFMALGGLFSWKLAKRLGASAFWAAVAGVCVVCAPLLLSVATGIMNETVFFGLFMAAIWFSLTWVEDGTGVVACIILTLLTVLQRQQGGAVLPGVALGFVLVARRRPLTRRDALGFVGLTAAVVAALIIPQHLRNAALAGPSTSPSQGKEPAWFAALVAFPILAGLMLMPFAVGLLARRSDEKRNRSRTRLVPFALGALGLAGAVVLGVVLRADIFPGDYFASAALGPPTLANSPPTVIPFKPPVFPAPVFACLELATAFTFLVLLWWRHRAWHPRFLGIGGVMLLFYAGAEFAAIIYYGGRVYDRFFLEVIPPLVPLVAAMIPAGAQTPGARAWALAALLVGVALYAVGEQDYIAWQVARDQATQLAYTKAPPYMVDAGWEESATHIWIPAADSSPGTVPSAESAHPSIQVLFAAKDDPRPGFVYNSIAPGKIVLQETNANR